MHGKTNPLTSRALPVDVQACGANFALHPHSFCIAKNSYVWGCGPLVIIDNQTDLRQIINFHDGVVTACDYSPSQGICATGQLAPAAHEKALISIWSLKTLNEIRRLYHPFGSPGCGIVDIKFLECPQTSYVLALYNDIHCSLIVWKTKTWQLSACISLLKSNAPSIRRDIIVKGLCCVPILSQKNFVKKHYSFASYGQNHLFFHYHAPRALVVNARGTSAPGDSSATIHSQRALFGEEGHPSRIWTVFIGSNNSSLVSADDVIFVFRGHQAYRKIKCPSSSIRIVAINSHNNFKENGAVEDAPLTLVFNDGNLMKLPLGLKQLNSFEQNNPETNPTLLELPEWVASSEIIFDSKEEDLYQREVRRRRSVSSVFFSKENFERSLVICGNEMLSVDISQECESEAPVSSVVKVPFTRIFSAVGPLQLSCPDGIAKSKHCSKLIFIACREETSKLPNMAIDGKLESELFVGLKTKHHEWTGESIFMPGILCCIASIAIKSTFNTYLVAILTEKGDLSFIKCEILMPICTEVSKLPSKIKFSKLWSRRVFPGDEAVSASFSSSGKMLAVAAKSGQLKVFEIRKDKSSKETSPLSASNKRRLTVAANVIFSHKAVERCLKVQFSDLPPPRNLLDLHLIPDAAENSNVSLGACYENGKLRVFCMPSCIQVYDSSTKQKFNSSSDFLSIFFPWSFPSIPPFNHQFFSYLSEACQNSQTSGPAGLRSRSKSRPAVRGRSAAVKSKSQNQLDLPLVVECLQLDDTLAKKASFFLVTMLQSMSLYISYSNFDQTTTSVIQRRTDSLMKQSNLSFPYPSYVSDKENLTSPIKRVNNPQNLASDLFKISLPHRCRSIFQLSTEEADSPSFASIGLGGCWLFTFKLNSRKCTSPTSSGPHMHNLKFRPSGFQTSESRPAISKMLPSLAKRSSYSKLKPQPQIPTLLTSKSNPNLAGKDKKNINQEMTTKPQESQIQDPNSDEELSSRSLQSIERKLNVIKTEAMPSLDKESDVVIFKSDESPLRLKPSKNGLTEKRFKYQAIKGVYSFILQIEYQDGVILKAEFLPNTKEIVFYGLSWDAPSNFPNVDNGRPDVLRLEVSSRYDLDKATVLTQDVKSGVCEISVPRVDRLN
eukprot:GHVP01057701.1.p1 GENE.GHVP01057701.1~~GHVP01057701.1.p1  ORF type:complete len:1119 (+),score=177.68 GHVP01057701.1:2325-5681(+)